MLISVIISTYNRRDSLLALLHCLQFQTLPANQFEVIIIDNGSCPAVEFPVNVGILHYRLIRFSVNRERCESRNTGAIMAHGKILVFLDDDLTVNSSFLASHLEAHSEWPGALMAGAVLLPPERLCDPFIKFRQALELMGIPKVRGLSDKFGAPAGNMSIAKDRFFQLGGFNPELAGIEDVDFSHRHSANNGPTVYLPDAIAIHHDNALDIRTYCLRTRFAAECSVRLGMVYPEWEQSQVREHVNGIIRLRDDSFARVVSKVGKRILSLPLFTFLLIKLTLLLERIAPNTRLLPIAYTCLIGLYSFSGYRCGLRKYLNDRQIPTRPELSTDGRNVLGTNLTESTTSVR